MKELPTNEQKHILESEVDNNLGQLLLGRELKATFQYRGSYLANPWEYKDVDADFGKFITADGTDVAEIYAKKINENPKMSDYFKMMNIGSNVADLKKTSQRWI